MKRQRQARERWAAALSALGFFLAIPAWVSSCSTQSSLADAGGTGGQVAGGGGVGGGSNGVGGGGVGGGSGGMCAASAIDGSAAPLDAGSSDAGLDGPPVACPVLNDPLAPPLSITSSTFVGARGVIVAPFMIDFDTTFLWTATDGPCQTGAGTFDNPTSGSTTFRCTRAGDLTITVHLGLPNTSCDTPTSWAVHCQP